MCWFSAEDEEKWKMKLKMTRGAFDEIHGAASHVDVTSTWGRPTKVIPKITGQDRASARILFSMLLSRLEDGTSNNVLLLFQIRDAI
ncbi:hypothetical protein BDN70DRAFT_413469 [Pholiota conissans]|uniref:Uncharacterized protein n=1 Tax=Pholiota conissans TaxID=109636 RepID=A0A9P6CTJ8_9AGAR|nr:hypothetical protein BDN70DRAFT_413469 [Pholiota conissans]